ncbi:polymer-forming cytoskeletal protein [Acidovorax sp.]|uniref:bactofilin family protein n=1 Tax=Acidovorax sp. TaxID=1872122 RepID=UPI00262FECFC|nr:polymer-forming cytoskeletal protein [Acidovorax sp.]
MAVQNPFFGKREPESFQPRSSSHASSVLGGATAPGAASAQPAASPAVPKSVAGDSSGSKLTVGPNIKLKGVEITDCDTLVVEGTVEATMDSRVIQISENGAFKGSAEIDIAEIHGEFNGSLTVRQKLVIYSTGKVNGKIRYGKLVVEEGGQLAGEIEAGFSAASSSSSSSSPQRTAAPLRAEPAALAA